MLAEGITLSGVRKKDKDCEWMKDWRSSLYADAEGANPRKVRGESLRQKDSFLIAFCIGKTMQKSVGLCVNSENSVFSELSLFFVFERKRRKNHGRISCKSS